MFEGVGEQPKQYDLRVKILEKGELQRNEHNILYHVSSSSPWQFPERQGIRCWKAKQHDAEKASFKEEVTLAIPAEHIYRLRLVWWIKNFREIYTDALLVKSCGLLLEDSWTLRHFWVGVDHLFNQTFGFFCSKV